MYGVRSSRSQFTHHPASADRHMYNSMYIPQNTYRGQCVSIALAETVDTGVAKLPIRPCQGKKSVEGIEFPQRPPPTVDPSMSGWKVGG